MPTTASPPAPRKRVAIIGSGAGGMGALYALRNTNHSVHLFEAADRLGGHTNTLTYTKNGLSAPVDTGFFVLNTVTYPNFIAMLKHLNVPTMETTMTFSVSRDGGAYEWSGASLNGIFAQRRNLWNPRTWRMVLDILRFNLTAIELLSTEDSDEDPAKNSISPPSPPSSAPSSAPSEVMYQETLGAYLERKRYSPAFIQDYLLPMTAAVWSTPADKCALEFPAQTLVRFMWNHHLLSTLSARPAWLTIKGGSRQYIEAILKYFPQAEIHLRTPVRRVVPRKKENGSAGAAVLLDLGEKGVREFDHVIVATHGDQARQLLGAEANELEARVLDAFTTIENTAVLHGDMSLMPVRPLAHAAWNILTHTNRSRNPTTTTTTDNNTSTTKPPPAAKIDEIITLTYNMTLLQSLDPALGPVLVTLNPASPPHPSLTAATISYRHPLYTPASIHAQSLLPLIQGQRGVSFAGAWTRYGFHEDGFASGVKAVIDSLGGGMGGADGWVDSKFVRGKDGGRGGWKRVVGLVLLGGVECVVWVVGMLWGLFVDRVLRGILGKRMKIE